MQDSSSFMTILVVAFAVAWILTTWIRAKYGYPLESSMGTPVQKEQPSRDIIGTMQDALVARDIRIAKLEQRVRVLERIVTDRRTALVEEIDDLGV